MGVAVGIDGCRYGWFMAWRDREGRLAGRVVRQFDDVLKWPTTASVIAVDIPIGLLDHGVPGGRDCDRSARILLGRPRRSSVFSPPVRAALVHADNYDRAQRANRSHGGIGLSRQTHAITRKIAEVDDHMTPALQKRIFEVHPEVCFFAMNGDRPMKYGKKTARGRNERLQALRRAGFGDVRSFVDTHAKSDVGRDDVVDAIAACWTASRIREGRATSIASTVQPQVDGRGLKMQMWY